MYLGTLVNYPKSPSICYHKHMDFRVWLWLVPVALGLLLLLSVRVAALWQRRKLLGELTTALFVVGLPFAFTLPLPLWPQLGLAGLHILLLMLSLRLVFGRLSEQFLRVSTFWNAFAAALLLGLVWLFMNLGELNLAIILLSIAIVLSLLFLYQILWSIRKFQLPDTKPPDMHHLPTVSVCIPARNEDVALAQCIEAVLASTYSKLEVLVLDDCSQDKTADIIRSFAHDGVRFVAGSAPSSGWTGKNRALATLAEHAAGDLLLFLSVDTRLSPSDISNLVHYSCKHALRMVSVLPQDIQPPSFATLLAPLHYFWQMAIPISRHQVPVSSKCWLIDADSLKDHGGFAAVRHATLPESVFARTLLAKNEYRFVVANQALPMRTVKDWRSQVGTATRLLYPMVENQPFLAGGVVVAILLPLMTPFVLFVLALTVGLQVWLLWLTVIAAGLFLLSYGLVLRHIRPKSWWLGVWCAPLVVAQEIVLLLVSLLGYEFSEIRWKGRNVCYPVVTRRATTVGERQAHVE